jgi:hypothetical protein
MGTTLYSPVIEANLFHDLTFPATLIPDIQKGETSELESFILIYLWSDHPKIMREMKRLK